LTRNKFYNKLQAEKSRVEEVINQHGLEHLIDIVRPEISIFSTTLVHGVLQERYKSISWLTVIYRHVIDAGGRIRRTSHKEADEEERRKVEAEPQLNSYENRLESFYGVTHTVRHLFWYGHLHFFFFSLCV
jgi:hypothetical protein